MDCDHADAIAALQAVGLVILAGTGVQLAVAWQSLIRSFGQLNTGKFKVINRLEQLLPVAIYRAEWTALEEGRNPKVYRTFTSREVWVPRLLLFTYLVGTVAALLVAVGAWAPG